MPKFKTSDLIIIVVLVLLVIGLGCGIYYYSNQIEAVKIQRQAKEQELQGIRKKVADFASLQDEVARNEAAMQKLADYIPDQEGQAEFIVQLDDLTSSSGVKLQNCSVSEQPVSFPNLPEYQIYQWSINLESNYPQLMKFLETVPKLERSVMVSKVNISAGAPDENERKSKARYNLNIQLTMDLIATTGKKVIQ